VEPKYIHLFRKVIPKGEAKSQNISTFLERLSQREKLRAKIFLPF